MKKLMILGAGVYQVPLIRQARAMGFTTVVVSIDGNYPGFALADKIYNLDTRDCEGILAAARAEQIDGICTAGTDVAVRAVGYVCSQMKLPGIGQEAAQIVTNKKKMKEAFMRAGVSTAAFHTVKSFEQAQEAAHALGYPVVLKIVDSSGSRGIIKAGRPEELEKAYGEAAAYTSMPYLLVEEFIDAEEIGIDAFVIDHELCLMLPHDKFICQADGVTIPMGHHFPYRTSDRVLQELTRQMQLVINATGMNNCPVNADVFVKGSRVWVVEAGGRSGATCIPELISMHCGFNYYEQMIYAALGVAVDFTYENTRPCMAKLIFSNRDGTITSMKTEVIEQLEKDGIYVRLDYSVGDRVSKVKNGTSRIGHVIAATDREAVLDEIAGRVRENIWIDGQNMEVLWNE